ncbi:MAG: glutathione S-transferase family protein [bacterium]|nr:glutathione S-transferase family protein [bacterium]
MTRPLRLIGMEMSPYTIKVRSYLRYKGIPFEWISRDISKNALFQKHAKVQLIPLVLFGDDEAMQDSTPIIERLERENPEPSIHPEQPASKFLSALLEEFGDEWCNKLMFQYRWGPPADCRSCSKRLAAETLPRFPLSLLRPIVAPMIVRRMRPRMAFAGANETNRPHLEKSWRRTVELLDAHLETRPYLFGGRPAFGDFGIWGNFYQAYSDPTGGAHVRSTAPSLEAWLLRMREPTNEGEFEAVDTLLPTLAPLLEEQVADRFLFWTVANTNALKKGESLTRLRLDDGAYEQKTFKYHAWSLERLKEKLEPLRDDPKLREILGKTGCWPHLA